MNFNIFKKEPKTLTDDQYKLINDTIGYSGRMISASKRTPQTDGRDHLVVFNGNLIVEGYGKVWYGDLDITRDEAKIKELAKALGTIYILREMDCRFDTAKNPDLGKALFMTDGDEIVVASPNFDRTDGKLLRRV
jgi:hypothetical protein